MSLETAGASSYAPALTCTAPLLTDEACPGIVRLADRRQNKRRRRLMRFSPLRACFVLLETCEWREVDAFALGGAERTAPKACPPLAGLDYRSGSRIAWQS